MNSSMFNLLLLILGVVCFQPAHQYRLSKRELTEYDLTSFIVGTCSAKKTNMLIENLCDQTLQSALMGTFPFLTYYCQTIGAGMSYCIDINRHLANKGNADAKRLVYRRMARSLHANKPLHGQDPEMKIETDLEQKLIIQMCMIKTPKSSVHTDSFCEQKIAEIQQGQYPEIPRLCQSYPNFEYCHQIRSQQPSSPSVSASTSSPDVGSTGDREKSAKYKDE